MAIMDEYARKLAQLDCRGLYDGDFFCTWEHSDGELQALFTVADALSELRRANISPRLFDSGLGVSLFRDNSTRTRFSFASACNMLGLAVQDLDEKKSQLAHGETVRETANMVSFMAEAVGIRDDMYIGRGNAYMREVAAALRQGYQDGVLEQRPTLVNLQCDIDHPTQTLADTLHLQHCFPEGLAGKKITMSWAYSPSYGKPLSVPQGIVGLLSRFGAQLTLAYPEGYELLPQVVELARKQSEQSGGSLRIVHDMGEAMAGADIVYPKSWAPYAAMEQRTRLFDAGDEAGIEALEQQLLAQNARHQDWEYTEQMAALTHNDALYLHCLPADISGLSCERGEVAAGVFQRFRQPLYQQAGYKPYIIAAMIFLAKVADPAAALTAIERGGGKRDIFRA